MKKIVIMMKPRCHYPTSFFNNPTTIYVDMKGEPLKQTCFMVWTK